MARLVNPYDPPREQSRRDSRPARSGANASVFWFVGAAFVVNMVGMITSPTADTRPMQLSLTYMTGPFVIAAVSTIVVSVSYEVVGFFFKRRAPATRLSRIMAALVFCSIVWLFFQLVIIVGFDGPPGIVSLPVAAIAGTFVDRLIANIARSVARQSTAPVADVTPTSNGTSSPLPP